MQYTLVALAAMLGLAVQAGITAFAFAETVDLSNDLEVVNVDYHDSVIFLLGDACKPNLVQQYTERFSQAWVVCADYEDWQDARAHLYGFEKYYAVVYATQTNEHPKASDHVLGEAFFRNGDNYALSINNPTVIEHELLHLECGCHFTPDGKHDFQKEDLIWLWRAEH